MTTDEFRRELGLSIRSTRGLLHHFSKDDQRDDLDGLLDQIYCKADRDDLQERDCVKLLAILRIMRRALNGAMNGEAVLWTDIHVLKACIRKTLGVSIHDNARQAFHMAAGNVTGVASGQTH